MCSESQGVSARGEGDTVNPTCGIVQELATHGVEGESLSPGGGFRSRIDALDEAGEDTSVAIRRTCGEEDGVRVPRYRCNSAPDWLLEMLRDPPVVLLFEVADGDEAGARANGEFRLGGSPTDAGGGAIDAEEYKRRLPTFGRGLPHVGIAICGMSATDALR